MSHVGGGGDGGECSNKLEKSRTIPPFMQPKQDHLIELFGPSAGQAGVRAVARSVIAVKRRLAWMVDYGRARRKRRSRSTLHRYVDRRARRTAAMNGLPVSASASPHSSLYKFVDSAKSRPLTRRLARWLGSSVGGSPLTQSERSFPCEKQVPSLRPSSPSS